jgi:hypothetical protein
MKKVKITIELNVPNEAKWVSIDKDGSPCWFVKKPSVIGSVFDATDPDSKDIDWYTWGRVDVKNWKKTVTQVK